MLKKRFLINGFWLTATTLITTTIGIFFRVYLSNSIGAEAIGLYQLILTVYFFAVTLTTSGVTLIVTRLVTDCMAKGQPGKAKFVTSWCTLVSVIISLLTAAVLFFFAEPLGTNFIGDARTVLSLKVLAPSLPFMAVSACFRGYFYARRTVIKTASEQLIEQLVEMGVFALLVGVMAPMGLEYACCAVAIGTTLAEVVSFLYSLLLYKLDVKKIQAKKEKLNCFPRKAMSIGLPVTISACLRSGLSMLENVMIPTGLKKHGSSYEKSLADYGAITGMVMPILTFPSAFLYSFSMLMIPEVSEAYSTSRTRSIQYMTGRILRIVFLFSLPVSIIFCFFAQDLGQAIYHNAEVGVYLCILAPLVPFMYLDRVVDGLLKGLNEQLHYLSYNIIDSAVRVALIILLLPKFGIMGLMVVFYISTLLNTGLSLMRLLKVTEIRLKIFDWMIKPLAASFLPCLLIKLLNEVFMMNQYTPIAVQIVCVVLLYLFLMIISGSIKKEEVDWVKSMVRDSRPRSKRIIKIK